MKNNKILFSFIALILCLGSFLIYQKTKRPTVSVVMPIYNRPDLAPRSIESILNQTMKDFEFIIVDDGSIEETKKILKEYAKKDSRIRLLHNPENKGIAYSRQRGLDAARGTYVAIMDSDDWSVPDRLEKSLAFMTDHPEVTAMTGEKEHTLKKDVIPEYTIKKPTTYSVRYLPGNLEVGLMFYNVFPNNPGSFFKRDFVKKHDIKYDPDLLSAEDYDFWRQFVLNGAKMASVLDVLTYIGNDPFKPENYYESIRENSILVHKRFFSEFFTPTSDELKFEYNAFEKCRILQKIKTANKKNPRINQTYLENEYNSICPEDLKNSYYLTNYLNLWEGFIEPKDENTWIRVATKNTGKLVKINDNTIEIHWRKLPKETFVRRENGTWSFLMEGETITLQHPGWTDDFIITKYYAGCRVKEETVCARVKKNADGTVWLHWLKNGKKEEFKKKEQSIYEKTGKYHKDINF